MSIVFVSASPGWHAGKHVTSSNYLESLHRAGAQTLLYPLVSAGCADELIGLADGVLIPGGADVSPFMYGHAMTKYVANARQPEDLIERELILAAVKMGKPLMCICRGIQLLNAVMGGTLYQDIYVQQGTDLAHSPDTTYLDEPSHRVSVQRDSFIYRAAGREELLVNSFHHQAIKDVAPMFKVTAQAEDGVIEGIEHQTLPIFGFQWHPEMMTATYPEQAALFEAFVKRL